MIQKYKHYLFIVPLIMFSFICIINHFVKKPEPIQKIVLEYPIQHTWYKVKNSNNKIEVNSKGEQLIYTPSLVKLTEFERMLEYRDYFNSPIDDDGIRRLYMSGMANLEDVKINHYIDPVIPFCIAVSDSELGTKGLGAKTKNPCNIGNNDGGGIKRFPRYTDGLYGCIDLLRRPQYKNTDTIGELSNGGRILLGLQPDCGNWDNGDKCWATSMENHYLNVVRCVRNIKQNNNIDYNYRFKL